ncbi:MAG: hypothetical protein Q4D04_13050, partial [Clostridia bacterium]|nr:hypothetical protein [Clostridia bacterium]
MQTELTINAPMFFARGGDRNYMMRSERRGGHEGRMPPKKKRKKPSKHPVYAFFTILLLLILFPVGLIMLWVPKLRWTKATKLVLTVVTGVLFFLLMAFALNFESDNQTITDIQNAAKSRLDYVFVSVRETATNTERMKDNLFYHTPRAADAATSAALSIAGNVVSTVHDNTRAVIDSAPVIAGTALKYISDAVDGAGSAVRSILPIQEEDSPVQPDAASPSP